MFLKIERWILEERKMYFGSSQLIIDMVQWRVQSAKIKDYNSFQKLWRILRHFEIFQEFQPKSFFFQYQRTWIHWEVAGDLNLGKIRTLLDRTGLELGASEWEVSQYLNAWPRCPLYWSINWSSLMVLNVFTTFLRSIVFQQTNLNWLCTLVFNLFSRGDQG